jgi:hypothetical protein
MKFSVLCMAVLLAGAGVAIAQNVAEERPSVPSNAASESTGAAVQPAESKPANQMDLSNRAWWSDRDAGWIGGIGGSTVGMLGALIGILCGCGIARRLVLTLMAVLIGLGVLSLLVGLIALALGQPYAVYYPLLLIGIILAAVCGGNYPTIRRRYEQNELRKMAALDAGMLNSRTNAGS